MIFETRYQGQSYRCDLTKPLDISIPVGQVKCFYAADCIVGPYIAGDFVGSVSAGAPINFFEIKLNPHGNGTHTECVGHITKQQESVNDQLKQFHFIAQLVSVPLIQQVDGDQVITKEALQAAGLVSSPEALILRTRPNAIDKLNMDYSGTNPAYMEKEAMAFLVEMGVKHLLLDLPSVDREEDQGQLLAHRTFWNMMDDDDKYEARKDCTITELIYVSNDIKDGLYLLNIQIPSIDLDAAPSKPVLYPLIES